MAKRKRRKKVAKKRKAIRRKARRKVRRKRATTPHQRRFAKAIDTCIPKVGGAKAGTRMKALGSCVKRELKKR